jgi:hypothetical protein
MRRTAALLSGFVLLLGLAVSGGSAPVASAYPNGTPVFLVGDSTMLGMAYASAGFATDARDIVAASFASTFDAASCRRVLAPSCRGHGVIPLTVVQTMQAYAGRLGNVVVVMAGYDDIDISDGVDAVLAEAARQGVEHVLWLDYPTNVPYHQPLSTADVNSTYRRHNAVLAAKAAANPMLVVAPWAEYSAGHSNWFQPDGIHMNFPTGADDLARFIVAQLQALPPPRCGGAVEGDPAPAPAATIPVKSAKELLDPVTPERVVDTRADDGDTFTTPVGAGRSLRVPLGAAGATAAVVNLTAADPCASGFLTAYACGQPTPLASNVNYVARFAASALTTVPLDKDGDFCVYTMSTTDVVADVYALSRAAADNGFVPQAPIRLLDTRDGSGTSHLKGLLSPNVPLVVPVSSAGVPSSAAAVALNITAVAPTQDVYVQVAPCGQQPLVSSLNARAQDTVANAGVVAVGDGDAVCVVANAPTDVLLDVTGWYAPHRGSASAVVSPTRLVDTRSGQGGTRLAAGGQLAVTIPGGTLAFATVNVTVVNPTKPGYVTVQPCGTAPGTSTVNYAAGETVANTATVGLDSRSRLCIFTFSGTDVVVDLTATS